MRTTSEWVLDRTQAESASGMVAAKTPQAAEAGAAVLQSGGNAVDAAVVTALVAGVVEPWMNGIGGGGYLVRYDSQNGSSAVVAFPMIAPRSARPEMFRLAGSGPRSELFGWPAVVDNANIVGHRAVCVPGTIDGLALALERFGSLSFARALEPAIEYAREGIPVTWHTSLEIARDLANLRRYPATQQLLCPGGIVPWSIAQADRAIFRQPDLARTLERLATKGPRTLYEGEIASQIVGHLNQGGADFSGADFSSYHATVEDALTTTYSGHEIHTAGNGSGGVTLAESLSLLDGFDLTATGHNAVEALHIYAQAFAIAFADRFAYLADPAHVDVPTDALLSNAYLEERCEGISQDQIGDISAGRAETLNVTHALARSMPGNAGGGSTTHLSVIDKDGVAVSLTQTLLSLWGSRITIPGAGIIMNNGMMWFDPEPGRPNSVAGGKRPLSNMAPAIVTRNGQALAALGASGGRRILNCVAQLAMNLTDHRMEMQPAVSAPRIDRSTPQLFASSRLPAVTIHGLEQLGHDVQVIDESLFFGEFASPACVALADGTLQGGVDPFYYPATAMGA